MSSDPETLSTAKVADLKALCKEKGLAVSGTKAELIARLSGAAPPAKKPRTAKPAKPAAVFDKPVFQTLLQLTDRDPIVIKRNAHGHFEHLETHLVFSAQKKVIGVQVDGDPTPQPLRTQDLEMVYKYHFELDPSTRVQDAPSESVAVDATARETRLRELVDA